MKMACLLLMISIFLSCHPDEIDVTEKLPFDINEITLCQIQTWQVADANYVVNTIDDFVNAVSNSEPGNTIYVSDNSYLDFSNSELPIVLDKSINIVSGRNTDNTNGAILYSNIPGKTLLKIDADNVTLSGLKIKGYDTIIGEQMYSPLITVGVKISNHHSLRIENCEISGWSEAGIYIDDSPHNIIIRNYIHHNRREGLGYGIVFYNHQNSSTDALISCNHFEYNRHDIAGSGNKGQSFEASYNIVTIGSESHHRFDMHGKNNDTEQIAGTKISIHNNWFLSDNGYAIMIRGIPETRADIYENIFAHKCFNTAFSQRILKEKIKPEELVNIYHYNNKYAPTSIAEKNNCNKLP